MGESIWCQNRKSKSLLYSWGKRDMCYEKRCKMKTGVSSISILCDTSQLFAAAAAELRDRGVFVGVG